MFHQWYKSRDALRSVSASKKQASGAGQKPILENLEEVLADEVIHLHLQKVKVTRTFIADRARQIAVDNNLELKATGNWVSLFLKRHGFCLRRTTNLTTLTDARLIQ